MMTELPKPPPTVAASDSAGPVAAKKLDNTLRHIGASRDDRPPRGDDLPLKPGPNYLNNGTNFVRKTQ